MVTNKMRAALVVALLMACVPLFAHHGSATHDTQKVVVLKDATITKFIWANPHSIAMFDVKDDKGNVAHCGRGSRQSLGAEPDWLEQEFIASRRRGDGLRVPIEDRQPGGASE